MRLIVIFSILLMGLSPLFSKAEPEYEHVQGGPSPWFTGPLLAPSGHAITSGHFNIEPYLYWTTTNGQYDANGKAQSIAHHFYNLLFQLPIQIGTTPWMDIQLLPQVSYKQTQSQHAIRFGDFPIRFDIQLLLDNSYVSWYPAIKLFISETLPTGKYQKLNPQKLGTDISGAGSFSTAAGLVLSKLFRLSGIHFLALRLELGYGYSAPVHVKGFNAYGGGYGTKGVVFPGNNPFAILGLELSLTQRWVFAMDIYDTYTNKTRFKGQTGYLAPEIGTILNAASPNQILFMPAAMKSPSSNQLSLAPALEYNWSPNLGIIGGVWFTVAGRNASRFISGVIAFNYYQ